MSSPELIFRKPPTLVQETRTAIQQYKMMSDSQKIYESARADVYNKSNSPCCDLGKSEDVEYFKNKMVILLERLTKKELMSLILDGVPMLEKVKQ